MKKNLQLSAVIILMISLFINDVKAQDIHFTENYASPMVVNPALTGLFNGGVRFTGIYRNQWSSITKDAPFETISSSIDFNLLPGAFANDQVSLGLMFYTDKAGDLNFSTNHINLSFGYASAFGDNDHHFLSFGLMGGFAQRSLDYTDARFGSQFDGSGHNVLINSGEDMSNESITFGDAAAGMMYYYAPNYRSNFFFGVGLYHINRPTINFVESNPDDRLHAKISLQVGGKIPLGENFELAPSTYYFKQGPNTKMDIGTYASFIFEKARNNYKAVGLGVFSRLGGDEYDFLGTDALMASMRIDLNELTLGVAYDFNISSLNRGTNGQGAIEIAAIYILQTKRRQKILHCPRF